MLVAVAPVSDALASTPAPVALGAMPAWPRSVVAAIWPGSVMPFTAYSPTMPLALRCACGPIAPAMLIVQLPKSVKYVAPEVVGSPLTPAINTVAPDCAPTAPPARIEMLPCNRLLPAASVTVPVE